MKSRPLFNLLKRILRYLAILTLKKYKPFVIGITGSAGKTSTKEAIFTVLSQEKNVRRSRGNFNNEIGVPLTVIKDYEKITGILFWPKVLLFALKQLIFINKNYPEILILELAADKPGDIQYLINIVKPKIGIITAIGEVPVHVENYSGPQAVAKEKSKLTENLSASGFAILNRDDAIVWGLKNKTRAQILSFGFNEEADIQILGLEYKLDEEGMPEGMSFKIQYGNILVPFRLYDTIGKPQIYAVAAAAAVGIAMGINLVKISESIEKYRPIIHRMNIIRGIKNTIILDDCYNASPLSMKSALETLKEIPAKRKVAILGDMLELGDYTIEAHEKIGKEVVGIADALICVGTAAKLIAESAIKHGFDKNNIVIFNTSEAARKMIRKEIKAGDLILVKASRAIKLDEVVEELKSEGF
ncbi:MAG: UDP-N-acetylmuramoyl-tripeptide--D-alanyl-D-alanine ligase [Patescibacteria group bacterium]|nr:UDP-N-acetylmuramoyl-tripeptide--D-alanyl-D-alanine ligase [Patescibacteria group bacterium]